MSDMISRELLQGVLGGDAGAAEAIFARYVTRLIALARRRISPRLAQRIDPEDVVQSAYRSFFVRAAQGDFVLRRGGDLWRLLAAITLNKLRHQVDRHTAARRNLAREQPAPADSVPGGPSWADLLASGEPGPDEALAVVDLLEQFMRSLPAPHRQLLEFRLQGRTIEEIATLVDRSQRTVRRQLEMLRARLQRQFYDQEERDERTSPEGAP